jgi:hypothetical protein
MLNRICGFEECIENLYFKDDLFCCKHKCWKCGSKHIYLRDDAFCEICQNLYSTELINKVIAYHNFQDKSSLNIKHNWYDRKIFETLLTLYNDKKNISDEWDCISDLQTESTQRRQQIERVESHFISYDEYSDNDSNDSNHLNDSDCNQITVTCQTCESKFIVNDAIWSYR